jgi:hypothetical protein
MIAHRVTIAHVRVSAAHWPTWISWPAAAIGKLPNGHGRSLMNWGTVTRDSQKVIRRRTYTDIQNHHAEGYSLLRNILKCRKISIDLQIFVRKIGWILRTKVHPIASTLPFDVYSVPNLIGLPICHTFSSCWFDSDLLHLEETVWKSEWAIWGRVDWPSFSGYLDRAGIWPNWKIASNTWSWLLPICTIEIALRSLEWQMAFPLLSL